MNNNFGIKEKSYQLLIGALKKVPEIEKAILFGSRAMGNHQTGSDIDIAIMGEKVNYDLLRHLQNLLNEHLPIPYFIDVIDYHSIQLEKLKEHIDTKGISIYEKQP